VKRTYEREDVLVIDQVLPDETVAELHRWIQDEASLEFINTGELRRVWSIADGQPLRSPSVVAQLQPGDAGPVPVAEPPELDGPNLYGYPSACPVDLVIQWLLAHAAELQPWVGEVGRDWSTLSAGAFVYPYGTGLDWHADAEHYSGAFTLYAHPSWKPRWGGELLIAGRPFEPERWDGTGSFVLPRPNRMVVVRAGVPHKIQRVSQLAGENMRVSVSGFFDRRTIAELLS
jgi:hypothetical protein